MPLALYLAAPLASVLAIRELATELQAEGHSVVSQWHSRVSPGAVDPSNELVRTSIWAQNMAELLASDAVVVVDPLGLGRGTLAEAGYAVARRRPIVWYGARCIVDSAPGVVRVDRLADILPELAKIAGKLAVGT